MRSFRSTCVCASLLCFFVVLLCCASLLCFFVVLLSWCCSSLVLFFVVLLFFVLPLLFFLSFFLVVLPCLLLFSCLQLFLRFRCSALIPCRSADSVDSVATSPRGPHDTHLGSLQENIY